MRLTPALYLALFALCGPASAADAFCGVDHVSLDGTEIQLHFAPNHYTFVSIGKLGQPESSTDRIYEDVDGDMHRFYPGRDRPEAEAVGVFLADGEVAFLGGDSHSSCYVRPAHEGGKFGLSMTLGVSFPGLPPRAESKFLEMPSR